jgi:hypothetical protein
MVENKPNDNPDCFKLEHLPHPGDLGVPDRDKQKLANQKQRLGGGKQGRVGRVPMLD